MIIRPIRIESLVKKVMSWANKKKMTVTCLCFYLLAHIKWNITNKCKKQKKQCLLAFIFLLRRMKDWRLQVSVSVFSCPSLRHCETDYIKYIHMEENFAFTVSFYAYPRLRPILAWALTSCAGRACCPHARTEEYIILASCLQYIPRTLWFAGQYACKRMSWNLFQNKMSCAS